MSTDTRRARRARRARGRFAGAFAITLAVLVALGATGAAIGVATGPRVSAVAADETALAASALQRVVFTTNEVLEPVAAEQVTVSPEAPFTVVSSGRTVAVQFTFALDPDTRYTIEIDGVRSAAGGPTATLAHTVHTAAPPLYLLQRHTDEDDAVFATNLAGDEAVPVFEADRIEEFRALDRFLVVQTTESSGLSALRTVSLDDGETAQLTLPGRGTVHGLQTSDDLVGYTFTSEDVGSDGALESALFVARADDPGAAPVQVAAGEDPRVVQWAFVPQTSSLLVLSFDGQLRLVDASDPEAEPVALGAAIGVVGIEPGTGAAIVERAEGYVVIDLTTLEESSLAGSADADALGVAGPVTPTARGAVLQVFTLMGEDGYPERQSVARVDGEGATEVVLALSDPGDVVMQVCASPSGRYAAVVIAPDFVDNPYDTYSRPLPERLETHIVDTADGESVATLEGTDPSWCAWSQ